LLDNKRNDDEQWSKDKIIDLAEKLDLKQIVKNTAINEGDTELFEFASLLT